MYVQLLNFEIMHNVPLLNKAIIQSYLSLKVDNLRTHLCEPVRLEECVDVAQLGGEGAGRRGALATNTANVPRCST